MIAISKSDAEKYGCPYCQYPIDLQHFNHGATDSALKCDADACRQTFIICMDGKTESAVVSGTSFRQPYKVQSHPFAPVAQAPSGKGLTSEKIDKIVQAMGLPPLSPQARCLLAAGDDMDRPTHESEVERRHRRRGRG